MIVHPISGRRQPCETTGTLVDLENPIAAAAVKVVVVAPAGGLESVGSAGKFDDSEPARLDEPFDVAVDGGDPEIRNLFTGDFETLLGPERATRPFEGPPDGGVLPCLPLHQRPSGRRHSTTRR